MKAVSFVAPVTRTASTVICAGKVLCACSSVRSSRCTPSTRWVKFTFTLPAVAFQSSTFAPRTSVTLKFVG